MSKTQRSFDRSIRLPLVTKEQPKRTIWEEVELGFGGGAKFRVLLHLVLNQEKEGLQTAMGDISNISEVVL